MKELESSCLPHHLDSILLLRVDEKYNMGLLTGCFCGGCHASELIIPIALQDADPLAVGAALLACETFSASEAYECVLSQRVCAILARICIQASIPDDPRSVGSLPACTRTHTCRHMLTSINP